MADDKLTRVHDTLFHCLSHTHTQSLTDTQTHTHADTIFPPITAPRTSKTGVVGWRLLVSQLEAALVNRRHCVVYNDGQSPPSHWLHQNVSPCQSYKTAVRPFITSPSYRRMFGVTVRMEATMCGRKEEEEDGTCSPTQMREKRLVWLHVSEWLCCMECNDWLLAFDRYQRGIHHISHWSCLVIPWIIGRALRLAKVLCS